MKRVCVFCGSSSGSSENYAAVADSLGRAIAARGLGLVYGGASVGLMGVLADSVLRAGGEVIGVIPRSLMPYEIEHRGLTELRVVASMHERKATMAGLSDGFIALPGGIGTMEEFFEVLTWSQLGEHSKPCGLLDIDGYFSHLLAFLDHAVDQRFLREEHRAMLIVESEPDAILDRFEAYYAPKVAKWIDSSTT